MLLKSQNGGASIVTVGFLSLFVLLLTISMTKLMTGELRHAIDLENNIKAYYQAEGGVEEAYLSLRYILATSPGSLLTAANQNCDKTDSSGANVDGVLDNFGLPGSSNYVYNPNITCRRVRTASDFVDSQLKINETAHFDLSKKSFATIEIEWDKLQLEPGSPLTSFIDFQQGGDAPPFLEMTRIEYTDLDSTAVTQFNPNAVALKSLYLSPVATPPSDCGPVINFSSCSDTQKVRVRCTNPTQYTVARCKATISNFMPSVSPTNTRTVLRLRPYFNPMHYTMKILDASGNRVDVALDKSVIDVTAKIGHSYRRIQQEVSLLPQPLDGIEAVFGDDKICKEFNIIETDSGQYVDKVPNDCRLNE